MTTPPCNDVLRSAKFTLHCLILNFAVSRQDEILEVFPCLCKLRHHFSLGLTS